MLMAHQSTLVVGAAASTPMEQKAKTKRVRVLRPFLLKGKPVEAGAVIEVESRFAAELCTFNKAEITDAPVAPAPRKSAEAKREV